MITVVASKMKARCPKCGHENELPYWAPLPFSVVCQCGTELWAARDPREEDPRSLIGKVVHTPDGKNGLVVDFNRETGDYKIWMERDEKLNKFEHHEELYRREQFELGAAETVMCQHCGKAIMGGFCSWECMADFNGIYI